MKTRKLRTLYIILSIGLVILFYSVPYLILNEARNVELATFWSIITLTWLIVTNLLLMRGLI